MAQQIKAADLVGRKGFTVTLPTWKGEATLTIEAEVTRMVLGGEDKVCFDWVEDCGPYFAPRVEGAFLAPDTLVTLH